MNHLPAFTAQGAGRIVLMLHGIGGSHLAFASQMDALAAAGYRGVAWDMPGYGSSAMIEPYTFQGLAQSCIDLIEHLLADAQDDGCDPPAGGARGGLILLGHSMGGMVAQEVVARRPDLVRQLILCGTSPAFGRKPDGSYAAAWAAKFVADRQAPLDAGQSMRDVAQVLVPGMVGPEALTDGVDLAVQCMGQVPPATYRRALEALVTFDRQADLARIPVPTLLLAGEYDKSAAPASMQAMARAIGQGVYVELPKLGHLMNMESADAFNDAILQFIRRQTA